MKRFLELQDVWPCTSASSARVQCGYKFIAPRIGTVVFASRDPHNRELSLACFTGCLCVRFCITCLEAQHSSHWEPLCLLVWLLAVVVLALLG